MSLAGNEEGRLLKRKDFLGVDEEAGTHPNRTYYYRKSSDLQKIIETCSRKLETDAGNPKALILRGNALLKLRDYENAIKGSNLSSTTNRFLIKEHALLLLQIYLDILPLIQAMNLHSTAEVSHGRKLGSLKRLFFLIDA